MLDFNHENMSENIEERDSQILSRIRISRDLYHKFKVE